MKWQLLKLIDTFHWESCNQGYSTTTSISGCYSVLLNANTNIYRSFMNWLHVHIFYSAANSINYARLLPQVVYHTWSYLLMVRDGHITMGQPVDICVPTGNFGNILGAYYSKVKQAQWVILWLIFHVYRVLLSKIKCVTIFSFCSSLLQYLSQLTGQGTEKKRLNQFILCHADWDKRIT